MNPQQTESVGTHRRSKPGMSATVIAILCSAVMFGGCYQGRPSEKPPIHVNPNMDKQPKVTAQSASDFFDNGAAMRTPVPGTVSVGNLREDDVYYTGKDAAGTFAATSPVQYTMAVLNRGQERFNIYCAVCHGRTGEGNGIVAPKPGVDPSRRILQPPSFHEQRLIEKEDGYMFDVITNGKGNMPSYRHQIRVDDRWAIVGYLRALQRSRTAQLSDIPEQQRSNVQ